ncbi:MAG: twin-arginine translocase subunit TatC [Lentimicrobium sp.]|jgi:sec-independent protein translocase protein TatC|nr:twin-arginine translocase subunit TatC [Lentimicrobium sp.]MDD2527426.1 twin-arginine translocase subunit TatC [Lentimicrobiaceae bacterium]MDD4597574.1 twin-arginine translocase subunit TatC [Lentimicrobiaceae bacterium]MDY0026612.1 twin-arginine translocase subunit TatC [Lentimicrobium sp.]
MAGKVSGKQKSALSEEKDDMSFWGHLDALRGHLFRSVIAIVILFIVAFLKREFIFDQIILAPLNEDFIANRILCRLGELLNMPSICLGTLSLKLININLSGQFLMHMYISFFMALTFASPYIIWEIWRFIRPALYENERKHSRGAVLVMSLLFILGLLFSYFLIVPLTLNFFGNYQVSESVANQIALTSYISTVVSVTFSMGVVFELPVFVYFLAKVGILTPAFLRKNRRYMIVILLTLAAIITPPDVVSQILVVIPLWGLYELSIVVAARALRNSQETAA